MATSSRPKSDWAVFIYLAGDLADDPVHGLKSLATSLQDDLKEILRAGASREVRIAVQHDHPETGAARYLLPNHPLRKLEPTVFLGKVDSGDSEVLADFLRWGLSECPAKRTALVLDGFSALDPGAADREGKRRVFTICRDDSAGGYLDVIELGTVIRQVLREYGREQLELLAIDSCQTQFLELAYELEGRVEVLLAPQNWVPEWGWDYAKVLDTWKEAARQDPEQLHTISLASQLVPVIIEAYRTGKNADQDRSSTPVGPYVVSALDLCHLDDVARAFDTLCIGMLQVLGEGLIWKARELVLKLLNQDGNQQRRRKATRKQEQSVDATQAYDCGSLFALLAASLEAMADESTQGWLGVTLERGSGVAFDRFRTVAVESLERLEQGIRGEKDLSRLGKWIRVLRSSKPVEGGRRMLKQLENGRRDRVRLLQPGHFDSESWSLESQRAHGFDIRLDEALKTALRLLPEDRQVEYERQRDAAASARRLAQQAKLSAEMLFGKEWAELLKDPSPNTEKGPQMVVATASTDPVSAGWPRWSGVSLYRPPQLDALMNAAYQGFRFHQRIHWAALLGATNLIESHPRALWRLVSSLLATGSAGTRRDLLQRLTGPDSVIWGLRDQFQVMAPAPTLTLSLEQRRLTRSKVARKKVGAGATEEKQPSKRENYLLRLESASSGAVINEQLSRVQPKVMDRALRELDTLLAAPSSTVDSLRRLRAIGGLLGDDIFQTLGKILEDERRRALEESAHLTPHLQLQIPRKLMGYPWELMHHNGEWLSEQFAIGRQVFMETGMARRVSRRSRGRVRPLIIGDPVFDAEVTALGWRQLPGAQTEAEQVAVWFERLRQEVGEMIDFRRERDALIHTRLTNQEFRDLLRHGNYDIIHFAGHGVFYPDDPETSAWMLSDGELWALEIRNTLANQPAPPWLVYANACEAGMESRAMQRRYHGNVFGLATAFLNQGVAAYVAPLWPIDDLLAQLIALTFYRQLLSERVTLGEALRRAKSEARRVGCPDSPAESQTAAWSSLGWASLVLFGDPTEELFQALAGSERKTQPAAFEWQQHQSVVAHDAKGQSPQSK